MNSYDDQNEVELMDYLTVIWKRRWLIIVGTLILVAAATITSFLLPRIWEVDAIMVPSKFMVQTEQGDFKEVVVTDPKQIAGQINQESYNNFIAKELNLDPRTFPKIRAENLRDTKLVRVWVKDENAQKAAAILNSLFAYLKADLDRKIEVEIKGIDTKIATNANMIKQKNLDIQSARIEIAKTKQEISSAQIKLKISEERLDKIIEEMKSVKDRVADIEKTQQTILAEKQEGAEALALLLYSNEVQQNLRYYDTLDEKFSGEKLIQENLRFSVKENEQAIKQLDTSIDKLKNEINDVERENELLNERKLRIDYTQLVKEPTSSRYPVFPRKRVFVLVGAILGLLFFTLLAFLLDYIEKKRKTDEKG
jgi:LPS O-antigen subunit length determinant protein (WzzB/FepE family)